MPKLTTAHGTIILSENCSNEMLESALEAHFSSTKRSFKASMFCNQYDDEGWTDCRSALNGELLATAEELVIAQEILDKRLPIEEAQALLK